MEKFLTSRDAPTSRVTKNNYRQSHEPTWTQGLNYLSKIKRAATIRNLEFDMLLMGINLQCYYVELMQGVSENRVSKFSRQEVSYALRAST